MKSALYLRMIALARRAGLPVWLPLVLIVLAALSACSLDSAKLERTRADLDALCAAPRTLALQAVCQRAGYLPAPLTDSDASE